MAAAALFGCVIYTCFFIYMQNVVHTGCCCSALSHFVIYIYTYICVFIYVCTWIWGILYILLVAAAVHRSMFQDVSVCVCVCVSNSSTGVCVCVCVRQDSIYTFLHQNMHHFLYGGEGRGR